MKIQRAILAALLLWCGRTVADGWFVPGETTEYKVTWARLPIAWSRSTTELITEEGRELVQIRMISKNYKAYNKLYKVDDITEVIIDPATCLPLRVDLKLREGRRRKDHLTVFDHTNGTAVFTDRLTGETKEVPIGKETRDIISFIYSMRNADIETLTTEKYRILVEGKMYDLSLKNEGESKVRLSEYGKVRCIELEPVAEFDGLFIRQGKVSFWISKETRRMITCVSANVPVGKIRAKLNKVSGPGDDFWVSQNKAEK